MTGPTPLAWDYPAPGDLLEHLAPGDDMPNQPKTKARTVRIDDPTWEAAQAKAALKGETVTDVVRRALRRYAK